MTCVGPLTETFLHVSHTISGCSQLLCLRYWHSFSDFQHLYKIRLLSESQSVIFVTQHILNALDASVRGRVLSCQQRFLKF